MESCKNCVFALDYEFSPACEKCFHHSNWLEKPKTGNPETKSPPMTNADAMRAMSDEELAEEMSNRDCPGCPLIDTCTSLTGCRERLLKWLQRPYEGE